MTVNVIAVNFDERSKAYQALSTLKGLDREGRIELKSAAVVERDATGRLQIPEGTDNASGEGFAAGGLIGMLVGILGGPVGVLLGLGTGGLIGGLYEVDQADIQDQTLAQVGRHVPPGSNALLAEVDEYNDGRRGQAPPACASCAARAGSPPCRSGRSCADPNRNHQF